MISGAKIKVHTAIPLLGTDPYILFESVELVSVIM